MGHAFRTVTVADMKKPCKVLTGLRLGFVKNGPPNLQTVLAKSVATGEQPRAFVVLIVRLIADRALQSFKLLLHQNLHKILNVLDGVTGGAAQAVQRLEASGQIPRN